MTESKRRSAFSIMTALIGLVYPLIPVMIIAVTAGVLGFLCAIFITILGGEALVAVLRDHIPLDTLTAVFTKLTGTVLQTTSAAGAGIQAADGTLGFGASGAALLGNAWLGLSLKAITLCMVLCAVLRGALRYSEQYCNHYIAFKLLALIRHKVFAVLRTLAPAKLEGKDKGNLISLITTDIELLEVFYAHTISPVIIAVLTSLCMLVFIGSHSLIAVPVALAGYLTVGLIIPLRNGKRTAEAGLAFRTDFGNLNSFVLESLRGLEEIIQYGAGQRIRTELRQRSEALGETGSYLSMQEARQRVSTNTAILLFTFLQLFLSLWLFRQGHIDFAAAVGITLGMSASFGPVLALAQLSNNLHQTLASGNRILDILEEEPLVEEVPADGTPRSFEGLKIDHIDFGYGGTPILRDYSAVIPQNTIVGIHGASGSGKSTLLKLMMRFREVQKGSIRISGEDINAIPTASLRALESSVAQESMLFKGSIAANIKIGKLDATEEEIIAAAQKASIHEFIAQLPNGYDTPVGELGDTLSGGEKQRIALARAFLHDAPLLLLDEPTSNLDALNEGIILKSLKEACAGKTVVLVSHRMSTLNIADDIITV